jgi:2-polyprenyl-3-methyl-5-hydroxy-6-metoxy-1,4-benzoquinol methylase
LNEASAAPAGYDTGRSMASRSCVVCKHETRVDPSDDASVHSNVRAFRNETFAYWRCGHCATIHARDEVDLGHYYAKYPFHRLPDDWRLKTMYASQLSRLEQAGVQRSHKILDYGCGGGQFVDYLKSRGFEHVRGFDQYSDVFGDRSVLDDRYDCILSQDVIEHVPSPNALLAEFHRLTNPGAVIAIGTPNATAIDLQRPDDYVHTVHAPYHRHILSGIALVNAGERQGLTLDRFYPTMYTNTRVPFLNEAFYLYYSRLTDGTLDGLLEPIHAVACMVRAPVTLYYGFFGSFFSRHTDVTAVFRRA